VRVDQVNGDAQLLELWLHGRSPHTQRAYRTDFDSFVAFVSKPLRTVTIGDVSARPPSRRGESCSTRSTSARPSRPVRVRR